MARLESYTRSAIRRVMREAYREHQDPSAYKNNVDLSKSHLDYSMMGWRYKSDGFNRRDAINALDARCKTVMEGRRIQTQTNVIGSWACTCPVELLGDPVKEKEYFETCYRFVQERYGAENVIDGVVHYDETTPHMTVYVCPVCISRKTGKQTISSASLFTRTELKKFHSDLDLALEKHFGIKGLALNGRTKGGYTTEEMKQRTKDEAELKAKQDELFMKEMALKIGNDMIQRKLDKQKEEQDARQAEQDARQAELDALWAEQNKRQAKLNAQQVEQDNRQAKLDAREAELDARQIKQDKRDAQLEKQARENEEKRRAFDKLLSEVQDVHERERLLRRRNAAIAMLGNIVRSDSESSFTYQG